LRVIPFLLLAAAPRSAGAADEVTRLDPVFVEASSGNSWRYLEVPGFEILSRCPETFTLDYAQALQKDTAARLAVLPESFWGDLPTPIKVILYNRAPERSEVASMNPIDLSWSAEDGAILGSDSLQLSHPVTVGDGDTFINCGNYRDLESDSRSLSVDLESTIRLGLRVPHFPAWFITGLEGPCGVLHDRVVQSLPSGEVAVLPNALWVSSSETIALQNEYRKAQKGGVALHPRIGLPLEDLFRGPEVGPKRDLWNAEAALFVRWGLFRLADRQAFLDFVDKATKEPVNELLFTRYFGIGYAEAQRRLGDYLPAAVSEPVRVPFATPPDPTFTTGQATSIDVARIIGDWGRLEGRSVGPRYADYRQEWLGEADKLFDRVNRRGTTDPLFLAAFGLYALEAGDFTRGTDALEAATKEGVVRPRAYVDLAQFILNRGLPAMPGGIGDLTSDEFTEITALLSTARAQMPALLSSYYVLARAMEHAPTKPPREDLGGLDEGVRLFPQNTALAYKVATLYRRLGYSEDATAVAERALRFAESDEDRARLSSFLAPEPR
jgi:tetratricopeptide (TPR) repeat protein